jgi:hypothetical protein
MTAWVVFTVVSRVAMIRVRRGYGRRVRGTARALRAVGSLGRAARRSISWASMAVTIAMTISLTLLLIHELLVTLLWSVDDCKKVFIEWNVLLFGLGIIVVQVELAAQEFACMRLDFLLRLTFYWQFCLKMIKWVWGQLTLNNSFKVIIGKLAHGLIS